MEHLDKLIPLALLMAVGAVVIALIRRAFFEEVQLAQPSPLNIASPSEPAPVAPPPITPVAPEPMAMTPEPASPKIDEPAPAVTRPKAQTPIVTVLELLKRKDSQAAAFLLHEILAPPVSKRR